MLPRISPGKYFLFGILAAAIALSLSTNSLSQQLPERIHGYKVYRPAISMDSDANGKGPGLKVEPGSPELIAVGLSGVTFSVKMKLTVLGQSGEVDFIKFRNIQVNGIPADIGEYRDRFTFEKGEAIELREPFHVTVALYSVLRSVPREIRNSSETWRIAGRVFVFGKFRRYGLKFRRAVPVDIDLLIPNPIAGTGKSGGVHSDRGGDFGILQQEPDVRLNRVAPAFLGQL